MRLGLVGLILGIGFALVAGAVAANAGDFKYVGAGKCKICHKKELMGNQNGAWQKSPHAKAFETLKGAEAQKIARKP